MHKSKYLEACEQIVEECKAVICSVDAQIIDQYISMLWKARKVFFVGVGRVLLSLEAMAKRYQHLGIECVIVGDITEPAITNQDVLIVGSGSGSTMIPRSIALKAKEFGATVIHIGSVADNPLTSITDLFVRLPAQSKKKCSDEVKSNQPMTSLFEQSLLLFGDATAMVMVKEKNIDIDALWEFHANLE